MPLVSPVYHAPFWLRYPHVQTVARALLPAGAAGTGQVFEELILPDGDRLELHWSRPHPAASPLAVLCHGLEGCADSSYMRGMSRALGREGFNSLRWSYRGCGLRSNLLARSYHSGATEDLEAVVARALEEGAGPVVLAGFSLGGNLVLKYLGERRPPDRVRAAVAVSAPVDLASSADALDLRRENAIYRSRFLRGLRGKAAAKERLFPDVAPRRDWSALRSVRAFDEVFTAPMHGFAGADDYYARCSALPLLERVSVPVLLLSARDDPLLARRSFPEREAEANPFLFLDAPAHGGHLGFLDPRWPLRSWTETRVPEFLLSQLSGMNRR
jgi:predicted alpha/beta-fold hydrolase